MTRKLVASVATLAVVLLASVPALAQWGWPFFQPYQQPQERREAPPPADYSKAPAAKKPETPPTTMVAVMGDSMADWLAYGLEDAFSDTPEIGILRKNKPNSGLIRYESRSELEWSAVARDILNAEKPAVAVMMLGLSDRDKPIRERPGAKPAAQQPDPQQAPQEQTPDAESPQVTAEPPKGRGSSNEFRSEVWAELYSRRIADTMAAMKSRGVPVIWVGLPIIRGARSTSDAAFLNDLYRAAAEKAGVIYVDVWDGFVDENGKFASSGPDVDGQTRRLRAPDGVYFTRYGARKLAHYVEREIRRVIATRALPVSLPVDVQPTGRPRADGPVARPLTGAVLPLSAVARSGDEALVGGATSQSTPSDPIASRVLVKGEPVSPLKGRADDFMWPLGGGGMLPVANTVQEPGTIKPVEPVAAKAEPAEEKKAEVQAAPQQPRRPRPAAPAQAQQQREPQRAPSFFSPFGFGFFR